MIEISLNCYTAWWKKIVIHIIFVVGLRTKLCKFSKSILTLKWLLDFLYLMVEVLRGMVTILSVVQNFQSMPFLNKSLRVLNPLLLLNFIYSTRQSLMWNSMKLVPLYFLLNLLFKNDFLFFLSQNLRTCSSKKKKH